MEFNNLTKKKCIKLIWFKFSLNNLLFVKCIRGKYVDVYITKAMSDLQIIAHYSLKSY